MNTGVNETNDMNETVSLEDPEKRTRISTSSLLDDEDLIVSSNPHFGELDD
jgi:hypothetical protein